MTTEGFTDTPTIADSVAVAETTGLADAIRRNEIATESDRFYGDFCYTILKRMYNQAKAELFTVQVENVAQVALLTAERDEWKGRAAFAEQTILAQQQRIVELEREQAKL